MGSTLNKNVVPEMRKRLLRWFGQEQRELPWRATRDPYCVWVSEIMLQQTRVAAVIDYYNRFLQRFPDVHALAAATEADVLAHGVDWAITAGRGRCVQPRKKLFKSTEEDFRIPLLS